MERTSRNSTLVPKSHRSIVLYLSHTHQLGAHLGVDNTKERIFQRFFWPGIHKEVENFCRSCPECQQVALVERFTLEWVERNRDVFSSEPGHTHVIQHEICTIPGKVIHQRPYRVPEAQREATKKEVRKMLKLGVIEESQSAWSSPIVLVPKPDGTIWFCNDFRKLNEVSVFKSDSMPHVVELIGRLGKARFITTLDLIKGYWAGSSFSSIQRKDSLRYPRGAILCSFTFRPAWGNRLMD